MAHVAFVLADGFEDSEFKVPYDRLRDAGHEIAVVGTEPGQEVSGKRGREMATIDSTADEVDPGAVDALVVPGGWSPDRLRTDERVVSLVRAVFNAGKPVAAICHGGSLLIEADVVDGMTLTSWPSIRTDLVNAGAEWEDRPVVEHDNLITSRKPDDLDFFCDALLKRLS